MDKQKSDIDNTNNINYLPESFDGENVKKYKIPFRGWGLLGIKKLDVYLIGKFISTFVFAIMILAVISCVIDYSEKVDNFVQKKVPLNDIVHYYMDFVPHITALLFPLFIFISTIFFTSKLAYKSEIIAMLSAGVSFQRFLRPYFIGGGLLCLVSFIANHWVIPVANKNRVAFEDKYINDGNFGNYLAPGENVHLGIGKDNYIYMQSFNFISNTGNHFTCEKIKGTLLAEKLMADWVNYDTALKIWHLHNVTIRTNDTFQESVRTVSAMDMKYAFVPSDLEKNEAIKEALTTPQLNKYINTEQTRGRENLNFYFVEKERRSAQPFAGLILTIIGVCIASKKIRGGSGFHLALGIVISAIYIMFLQTSTTFATKSNFSPFLAVWLPNFVFGIFAFYLCRRQIK